MNYFGISHTYRKVVNLTSWLRRKVRFHSWSNRSSHDHGQPRLIALTISAEEVHMASRSRTGY
ncbi:MAG: Group intron-encoded protein LtrA [Chthoniobacteraceae bacterium]|nr:Group intron-encoded protein LtrA [Chthoniobacteraceae bacterium]